MGTEAIRPLYTSYALYYYNNKWKQAGRKGKSKSNPWIESMFADKKNTYTMFVIVDCQSECRGENKHCVSIRPLTV